MAGFSIVSVVHELIIDFISTPSTVHTWLLDIEMKLLEYSTGRPHPKAKNATIFITSSSTRPALLCEIVGENLVLVLKFKLDLQPEDRIFIWNWCADVLKTVSQSRGLQKLLLIIIRHSWLLTTHTQASFFSRKTSFSFRMLDQPRLTSSVSQQNQLLIF